MCKRWNGYLTVEASFILPIVLFLYLLIVLCGFYLYNRCVISQDNYLIALRGSRFTQAGSNYGEVIYGNMDGVSPDRQYLEHRLAYKSQFYPFCYAESKKISIYRDSISVLITGYKGTLNIRKKAERLNIIKIIEGTRK